MTVALMVSSQEPSKREKTENSADVRTVHPMVRAELL